MNKSITQLLNNDTLEISNENKFKSLVRYITSKNTYWASVFRNFNNLENLSYKEVLKYIPIMKRELVISGEEILIIDNEKDKNSIYYLTNGTENPAIKVKKYTNVAKTNNYENAMFEWELHGRDFAKRTLVIRQESPNGDSAWRPLQPISKNITDFSIINSNDYKIEKLYSVFEDINPAYLFINPVDLRQLATYFLSNKSNKKGVKLSQVVVIGYFVDDGLRSLVRLAFNCEVINHYSCNELGYIAFQCPSSNHLHPNSIAIFTEILNSKNLECNTGEEGIVVTTDLNLSPIPLIKYEVGDLVLVGEKCRTSLNLQTIEKIVGRQSDRIIHPDGTSFIPQISGASFLKFRSLFDFKITIFENLFLFNAYSFTKLNLTQHEIIRSDLKDIFKSDMPVEVNVSSVPRWKTEQRRVYHREKGKIYNISDKKN